MKTLAIIEDDLVYTHLLKSKLGKIYNCSCYQSIGEFENNNHDLMPDIIIVDYYLPDGEGPSLIRKLRSKFMTLPILVMSQSDSNDVCNQSIKAGGSYFFKKSSLQMNDLLMKVKMLEGRE